MEELLDAARAGALPPVVLVRGDRALAEPAALRLASALGGLWGAEPVVLRHPDSLAALVEDLRTFALFATGKVLVAVGTGALADRDAAADLLAEVREVLPWSGEAAELSGAPRQAAVRLLQVLRLFDLDAAALGAERALAGLPEAVLAGGGRARAGRSGGEEARALLRPLLAAAVEAGLRGAGESEVTLLADVVRDGLPERHLLLLVESAAPDAHPLVAELARRGALVEAGRLSTARGGGVAGLDRLVAELERETGVAMRPDAAAELARRTLRAEDSRRSGPGSGLEADSTERFVAEYRKLAALAGQGAIGIESVRSQVEDRGEQDLFAMLDAIGAGRAGEALAMLERRLSGADDRLAERLIVFGQLAAFARRQVAVAGIVEQLDLPARESRYVAFRDRIHPSVVGAVDGLLKNPLAGQKEFPLFRAYQAVARCSRDELARLPGQVLETELRLKGESGDPDAALADFVVRLARPAVRPGPERSAESRRPGAGGGRS